MLRCLERYKVPGYGDYQVGDIIDDAAREAALLQDSPGSFEVVQVWTPSIDEAENRAILKPAKRATK